MRKRFPIGETAGPVPPEPHCSAVRRATIGDVAARAGVSRATVSKYFGDRDYYVSERTRLKIQAAASELDYLPNAAARALARQRSQMIGVVVPSIVNPYYPELIAGIEEVTEAHGYTLTLATTNEARGPGSDAVTSMRQQGVAGVILGVAPSEKELDQLRINGTEVVLVSRELDRQGLDGVQVDNDAGGELATRHLIEHGHRRIAHIAGPQDTGSFIERANAYRRACEEAGLSVIGLEVENRHPRMADGAEACRRLLASHSPTAVFVATDLMAMGVLAHCAERGIRVPDDLAVVGFDNMWVSALPSVALTTVDGATREVGRLAANKLLARLSSAAMDDEEPRGFTLLPPRLVRRHSCGC